jgi:hypothetical protein
MKNKFPLILLFFIISSKSFGQMHDYRYIRSITGIKEQWHKIELPDDFFRHVSPGFSDIRIFGITKRKDTIEVPYILQESTEKISKKTVDFKLINKSRNKNGYFFTFEIPAEATINQLDLDFKQQNFDWRISLEGSQNQQEWFSILQDYRILAIHNEFTDFSFSKIAFPDSRYRYYRVVINSKSGPELISSKVTMNENIPGKYRKYTLYSTTIKEEKKLKQTIVDLELTFPVPVSHVNFFIKDTVDYYRPFLIQYLSDSIKTPEGWNYVYNTLQTGTINSFEKNEFDVNSTVLKKLRLVIENQDDRPLQIDSLSVEGYEHKLVARFDEPGSYFLAYGNPEASKPIYDISRFADKIPTRLLSLDLGQEQLNIKATALGTGPLFQNKRWLWGIMVLVIITLAWFSFSMMRDKK